jgi:tetratricopeptide (TPR) repeat protein
LTTFEAANWHPATWLSHMADIELFGLTPGWHHATSLSLHLLAAVALLLVLAAMTGAPGRSFFVAALFAVHPLHVESVAWVAERKDVLSGLCFAVALAAWLRYLRRPSRSRYLAAAAVFAVGLTAKAMLVTFPFLLLLLDVWPFGRYRRRVAGDPPRQPAAWSAGRLLMEKLPLVLLSCVAAALTYAAQSGARSVLSFESLALPLRLANAAVSVIRYLAMAIWPANLAVLYAHPGTTLPLAWGAVAGLLVLLATALFLLVARRLPWAATGWLWYLGMLVPVIGLIQAGSQGLADRYTYLPLIGVFLAVVWGVELATRRHAWRPLVPWLIGAPILIALSAATFLQAGYWRDSRTLLSRAVLVSPNSWMALANLALVAEAEGNRDEAIGLYRRAALAAPTSAIVRFNLGTSLSRAGRLAEAEAAYRAAIALAPGLAAAHNNLATLLFRSGRSGEALTQITEAAAAAPDDREIRANLESIRSGLERR